MGLQQKKRESIESEVMKIWQWLKTLPEYRSDYVFLVWAREKFGGPTDDDPLGSLPLLNLEQELRGKWGFLPTINPDVNVICEPSESYASLLKLCYPIASLLGRQPDRAAVLRDWKLDAHLLLHESNPSIKLPELPHRLTVDINPCRSHAEIVEDISDIVRKTKVAYHLPDIRPRAAGIFEEYKTRVYTQLGYSTTRINKKVFADLADPDFTKKELNRNRESLRKRAYRIRKRLK